ncbi:DUF2247 family protein [Heyndrickxia coagulans]|uniref:DUF2247 family protein n=1 Tax=Heyndrickxia coagulans TaxID=1398 RepID=UPI0010612016|nr:DUF2247 family protein [Heyndrickxia coagulans]MBF8419108.1 DUF2247 family protein [Heyndrickxia coagulans]
MKVSLDTFKENGVKYDWKTLYAGLKLDLIKRSDIVNFAVEFLTKHPGANNQNVVQLAWGDDDLDYENLLENILKESFSQDLNFDTEAWQLEKRKWRFAVLTNLKIKYQNNFEELLNKIAEVYADFNYPDDMDSFIYYLKPTDGFDPLQYSKTENIIRLINLFHDFMCKEYQYLQDKSI